MKNDALRAIGKWLLFVGLAMLAAGIIVALTMGTIIAFILVAGSVLMNTAAMICIRWRMPQDKD